MLASNSSDSTRRSCHDGLLVANAVKFTPDGGHVTVEARLGDGEIVVAVRDTGIGFAPEDGDRIFDAFQQAAHSDNRYITRPEGTGLGLAIARRFVELHGGRIWATSEPGKGSEFAFTLPAPAAKEPPPLTDDDSLQVVGAGPLVLVIEDDANAVELLTVYLTEAGFSVVATADAEDGARLARTLQPAAITLDILLQGDVDGWDLLATIKADAEIADVPVVVVSILDERGKGFALGAADYFVKPVDREQLLAGLTRLGVAGVSQPPARTVLVVESDAAMAAHLESLLSAEGYLVRSAPSGQRGLQLAASIEPALVVVDVLLRDMDGIDMAMQLHSGPGRELMPILVLTSKSLSREEKLRLHGQVTYLANTTVFNRNKFLHLVRRLCPVGVT
jgi:DNA-binding response OmpR family regulator